MDEFDFEIEIEVRYRDVDAMGHVNNAVYATFLEQARVRYIEEVLKEQLRDTGAVVADLHIDFKTPIDLGQTVTVSLRVGDLGESSIPMDYEIRADGDLAATAETLMVTVDRETGRPVPMPDDWHDRVQEQRAG